jgi:hypothetical protein
MYIDTTISFLPSICTITAVISAESTSSCVVASSFDAQIHDRTSTLNGCLLCTINLVYHGFVPGTTT